MVKSGLCVFVAGVAILSNAPERLPEKKKPERGERERSRGHGSGGTNNPGSHGSSRQVRYKKCVMFSYFRTLSEVQKMCHVFLFQNTVRSTENVSCSLISEHCQKYRKT